DRPEGGWGEVRADLRSAAGKLPGGSSGAPRELLLHLEQAGVVGPHEAAHMKSRPSHGRECGQAPVDRLKKPPTILGAAEIRPRVRVYQYDSVTREDVD